MSLLDPPYLFNESVNGIRSKLGNLEFIYPGTHCEQHPDMVAYLASSTLGRLEKSRKYAVYLCKLFMNLDLSQKIQTLIHEVSHHELLIDVLRDLQFCHTGHTFQ